MAFLHTWMYKRFNIPDESTPNFTRVNEHIIFSITIIIGMNGVEGFITFTYHEDLERAADFYRDVLELDMVMDRSWVKIFKLGKDSHIGLVDSKRGFLKPSEEKPVMLSIFVEDVEKWYRKLTEKGVKTKQPPSEEEEIHMKGFLIWDPSCYVVEIFQFLTKPYGE